MLGRAGSRRYLLKPRPDAGLVEARVDDAKRVVIVRWQQRGCASRSRGARADETLADEVKVCDSCDSPTVRCESARAQ